MWPANARPEWANSLMCPDIGSVHTFRDGLVTCEAALSADKMWILMNVLGNGVPGGLQFRLNINGCV